MKTIAIVGGIGSGKSVVSDILRLFGYEVYDCDSHAKYLMNNNSNLQSTLIAHFGKDVVTPSGAINKEMLSEIIFKNSKAINTINHIVHPIVIDDIKKHIAKSDKGLFFIETAIPYESGLDLFVDKIWIVNAPLDIRTKRVMARNGLSAQQVNERIQNQSYANIRNSNITNILNDESKAVIPQIISAMASILHTI